MSRRTAWLLTAFTVLALVTSRGVLRATPSDRLAGVYDRVTSAGGGETISMLSLAYRLDDVYMSMEGPCSYHAFDVKADASADPEVVYLTGIDTNVVDWTTLAEDSNEFFCHANLTLDSTRGPEAHNAALGGTHSGWRAFTLVPGRWSIRLPQGFGVPMRSDERAEFFTMSLNANAGVPDRIVRIRGDLQTTTDASTRPVFLRSLTGYQQFRGEDKGPATVFDFAAMHAGELCGAVCNEDLRAIVASRFRDLDAVLFDSQLLGGLNDLRSFHPGATCCVANVSELGVLPQFGADNTIHWFVPPGRHEYITDVTEQLKLPGVSTAHYVSGHLHPYGKSLRLIDATTGETVVSITARHREDRLGVLEMSEVTSQAGIAVDPSHRYELVAEYENPTDAPIDAMAILYTYFAEPEGTDIRPVEIASAE